MIRIGLSFLLASLLVLPLAGCWDRREMNELGISVAMGIDKVGGLYQVTVQVVQPGEVAQKKTANGASTPVTMYESKGHTLFEAIRKMTTVSPRKIYASHLRVVLFGEQLARDGIEESLDLLSRDYELRTDFYILVARGTTAANALSILTPLEKIPANKIYESIETSEKVWTSTAVTLDEFITNYVSDGKSPVLSGIMVKGDKEAGQSQRNVELIRPAAELQNAGLAAFRKGKLIGWLDDEESKGYNYILNHIKSTVSHVSCPQGGNIALEVVRSDAKVKGYVKNRIPHIDILLQLEQNAGEVNCKLDLTRLETIHELEERAEQSLKKTIVHAVEEARNKYKTDIFGFGNAIHRADPGSWKTLKADWDNHFVNAVVQVKVDVKIKRVGTMTNSFFEGRKD
ncbi:MAG: Ger(x)C family germination protein [Paenibacillus sp.]|jgi:spore germination protein KC|nr:Ger(x)C family germination protein [Paenibacillus sp.]